MHRPETRRALQLVWGACLVLFVGLPVRSDGPPIRNRPLNFNGAVGTFHVTMEAKPAELRVAEALTLTVRITPTGPVQQPPRRPNLHQMTGFEQRFFIEDLPAPASDPVDGQPWEFTYRLKPRDTTVDGVPSLPFVYYKPAPKGSTLPGSFQTSYAPRLPLIVKPVAGEALTTEGPPTEGPQELPESFYGLAKGSAVLHRSAGWDFLTPFLVCLVLLGMPILCAGWYLLWQGLYPDAARLARLRRSLAARRALKALRGVRRQPNDEQVRQAAAIVAAYLREHMDLPVATPTADEAVAHLYRAGVSAEATAAVARFFHDCDAVRFAPAALQITAGEGDPSPNKWAAAAEVLILTLEAEPCPSPAS